MIPFLREGSGSFPIFVQFPLPGRAPANTADVSAVVADILDAETGNVITGLADVALTYDADLQGWFTTKLISLIEGYRFVQTRVKPTSANVLIQTTTSPPRAVVDILKRQDEIETKVDTANAALADGTTGLAAIKTAITSVQNALGSDGSVTVHQKLGAFTASATLLQELVKIEGAGFVTGTHSLVALKNLIDALQLAVLQELTRLEGSGFDTGTDTLEKIREAIDTLQEGCEAIQESIENGDIEVIGKQQPPV